MATLTVELPDAALAKVEDLPEPDRERFRQEVGDFAVALLNVSSRASLAYTRQELKAMPREQRERIMRAQAAAAAPLYKADLALPPDQRELTAFEGF